MTTLEKAAQAVLDGVLNDSNGPGKISSAGSEVRISGEVQFDSRRVARVALEALRNPTPDMCIAGGIAIAESMKTAETQIDNANECWRRMIGVILDEHSNG